MRLFYLFILFAIFFPLQTIFAFVKVSTASAFTDCTITTTLRMGSKGAEVQCLQRKVGATADGSFGPLTQASVKLFQTGKGLVADGIVGPLSRAALNGVGSVTYVTGCTGTAGYSPTTGAKCDGGSGGPLASKPLTDDATVDTNLINLDQFIETVVQVSRKNGFSEKELKLMSDTLKEAVTSSDVDFNQEFKNLLTRELSANFNIQTPPSIFDKIISKTLSFLGVTPSVAQAQTAAGTSFGGALIFPFFCGLSDNWMIAIQPLPPTFVTLLSYYPGTQGFASYNIPFTRFLLGSYEPAGVCIIPATVFPVTIPTEGTITPMTGSSPI